MGQSMCQLRLVGGSKIFVMVTPKRVEMMEFLINFYTNDLKPRLKRGCLQLQESFV